MRYWGLLVLVLLAPPAFGQSQWPANKVIFSDDATLEAEGMRKDEADVECIYIEDPVTDEEFFTIWSAPVALTITAICCEVTSGTSVALDLEIDDGTPAGVNGSNTTCGTTWACDETLAGDATMDVRDQLDLDLGTVTGTVDALSVCWEFTRD